MTNPDIGPFNKVSFTENASISATADGDVTISTGDDYTAGESFVFGRDGKINGKEIGGGGNDPQDTGWIAPTLLAGWINHGDVGAQKHAPAGYRKIGNRVFLRGAIKNPGLSGLNNSNLFQLPAGFFPGRQVIGLLNNVDKACAVKVQTNGYVYVIGVDATWLGLDMVSFLID